MALGACQDSDTVFLTQSSTGNVPIVHITSMSDGDLALARLVEAK